MTALASPVDDRAMGPGPEMLRFLTAWLGVWPSPGRLRAARDCQATALPLNYLTAWAALHTRARGPPPRASATASGRCRRRPARANRPGRGGGAQRCL